MIQASDHARDPVKTFAQNRQQTLCGWCQSDAVAAAVKERGAKQGFEVADLMADCAMSHVKLCRRTGNVLVSRSRFKGAQGIERGQAAHGMIP
jgi:hypothetical protein